MDTAASRLPNLQASAELAAAAGEVQAALASMHGAIANESAEIQREWAKYMQKVRRTQHLRAPYLTRMLRCRWHSVALTPASTVILHNSSTNWAVDDIYAITAPVIAKTRWRAGTAPASVLGPRSRLQKMKPDTAVSQCSDPHGATSLHG